MRTTDMAAIWDHSSARGTVIGVNWSAVGPVKPETVRRFARRLNRLADQAEARINKARLAGVKLRNPETIQ